MYIGKINFKECDKSEVMTIIDVMIPNDYYVSINKQELEHDEVNGVYTLMVHVDDLNEWKKLKGLYFGGENVKHPHKTITLN